MNNDDDGDMMMLALLPRAPLTVPGVGAGAYTTVSETEVHLTTIQHPQPSSPLPQ